MVGIAGAPDFTEELFLKGLTPTAHQTLLTEGRAQLMRAGGEPLELSLRVVQEGRQHLIFNEPLKAPCPVVLLHGLEDTTVPWTFSQRLLAHVQAPCASLTLIQGGNHRLARPCDLDILQRLIQA
jgi:alpha-beta hydrolase superfamily lysophospholipase